MYGYQDYPAPEPPVCAFKVCIGAQLNECIQQCEVTDLQTYYNRPAELDALKYTYFLESTTCCQSYQNIVKIVPIH
jgi:hypothetical protein